VIILQSRLSGLYFKAFGLWVAHAAEALHFPTFESAREFVASERVSDVALCDACEAQAILSSPLDTSGESESQAA
jgi:hypothetical protein